MAHARIPNGGQVYASARKRKRKTGEGSDARLDQLKLNGTRRQSVRDPHALDPREIQERIAKANEDGFRAIRSYR